jgi:hypothetical protein
MSKNGSPQTVAAPTKAAERAPAKIAGAPKPGAKQVNPIRAILQPVASLRLTVFLLGACMVLVLWGTLAQVDNGIHTVVTNYFRSLIAWVPLRVILCLQVPATAPWTTTIPFPGGFALGTVLMANLLAAHLTRFRIGWKRIGIWTIHIGVILLMLGELITGLGAVESHMVIEEGKSSNYLESQRNFELVLVDFSSAERDKEIVIPDTMLKKGRKISHPALPVDIEVIEYMTNSVLSEQAPDTGNNPATHGDGLRHRAERRSEVSGVDREQQIDIPAAYVEFSEKTSNKSVGVWLVSPHLSDQRAELDGKPYELALRFKRAYVPYTFHLTKFTHDFYPGTSTPKDYRSYVHLTDPQTGTERDVEIYMNAPLYFQGKTFYQADFLKGAQRGTVLQVVENPAWRIPYVACAFVSLGMLAHFGIHLGGFLKGQKRAKGSEK